MDLKPRTKALVSAGALIGVCGVAAAMFLSNQPADPRRLEIPVDSVVSPEAPPAAPRDTNTPAGSNDILADPASAGSPSNTSITYQSDSLTFRADFLGDRPPTAIEETLRKETQTYLSGLREELSESAQPDQPNPWEIRIAWSIPARSGDHVAVLGRASEYRGGAHPNDLIDARMMSAKAGEKLPIDGYFKSRTWPPPAVAIAACEALKQLKRDRIGSATIFDDPITCAGVDTNLKLEEARYMFAPSTKNDHFGGLYVLFQPYVVGAYSEGAYELTIPHEVFATDLKPAHASMFAGNVVDFAD